MDSSDYNDGGVNPSAAKRGTAPGGYLFAGSCLNLRLTVIRLIGLIFGRFNSNSWNELSLTAKFNFYSLCRNQTLIISVKIRVLLMVG